MKRFLLILIGVFLHAGTLQAQSYSATISEQCIATAGGTVTLSFSNIPQAASSATLTFYYRGDLDASTETFDYNDENGNLLITSNPASGQCNTDHDSISVSVPAATLNGWMSNGSVDFDAVSTSAVNPTLCTYGGGCTYAKLEYNPVSGPDDAGVVSVYPVANSECPASLGVSALIGNFGTNQITSANVNWSIDGVAQTAVSYSGLLDTLNGTGSTTDSVFLGNVNFTAGSTQIKVWTSNPNGNPDTTNLNDTAVSNQSPIIAPSGLSVSSIFSTSADVSWTSTGANSYIVIYGAAGFDPSTAGTSVSSSGSPETISGLSPTTAYDVYLIGDCGSGNFTDTAGPVSFTTACAIFVAPYLEDFETGASGTTPPNCWTNEAEGGGDWEFDDETSRQPEVADGDHTLGPGNGGIMAWIDDSDDEDSTNMLSPLVDVSSLSTPRMAFWFWSETENGPPAQQFPLHIDVKDASGWHYDVAVFDIENASWEQYFVDLSSFSDTVQVRFSGEDLDGNFYKDIAIDDVSFEQTPACPALTLINITNITNSNATVDVNDPTANFELEWGPCGFSQGTGTVTPATGSYTITGLTGNTCYDVYIRQDCGTDGFSTWHGPVSFTTACSPFTAPYFNDFESDAQDLPPVCWYDYETNTASFVEVEDFTGTAAPFAGSQALYLYSSSGSSTDTLAAISPQFSDMTAGDKQVRFYANSDDPTTTLIVGTLVSPTDPASFVPLDTIIFPVADTYQEVIVPITTANGYNGTHEYVALAHDMNNTFDYVRIDDFNYEVMPACAPPSVTSLSASAVTSSSADLSWGVGSDGDSTFVEVGAPGFTPGSGAAIVQTSSTGSVDTVNVSGLSSQTTYEFYVSDSCNGVGNSPWVGPFSFTTACLSSTLPYFEDFGSYTSFPTCWSRSDPADVDLLTSCASNSNVIEILWTENAVSPNIDVSGTSSLQVAYQIGAGACNNNPEDEDFIVEYWDGSQWVEAKRYNGNQMPNAFVNDDFILPGNAYSNTFKLRFNQLDGTTDTWQFDSVSVKQGPSCFAPTNLTATGVVDTSATLNWDPVPGAGTYQVWFGPQGFFQGTQSTGGVKVFTTTDSLIVDTLTGLTCYDYLVRAVCGPNDTTAWVGPYTFCTPCPGISPMTLPFTDGFEGFNTSISSSGVFFCGPSYSYEMNDPGGSGNLLFNYSASSGPSGPNTGQRSVGFESNSSSDPVELIFTADLSNYAGNPNLQMLLSFYFAEHADETSAGDKVWVRGSIGDSWIEILDWNSANANTWTYFEIRLDSVLAANSQGFSTSTQVRWGQQDNATITGNDGFSIDDLRLNASTCPAPTNLTTSNATQTSVDLSWTSGGSASGIVVEYGPPGFAKGTGQTVTTTSGSPFTVTGLTPGTPYEFYLRDSCGASDLSFYTGPKGDTTLCPNVLNGTYTIGATGTYSTFAAAASDLNLCGISGPVTFNVQAGTYTDNLHLFSVPGASATNTITFNGGGATLEWDGNGDQAAVLIDNTQHVTINDMTITNNAATEAWGVLLTNNADDFTLNNSVVAVDSSGSFATDVIPFLISSSTEDDFNFGADVDNVTIDSCELIGGYHGLQYYGNSASSTVNGLTVTNTNIRKFYISGMYLYSIDGITISNNTIVSDISVTDEDGIYGFDLYNYQIESNTIQVKDYALYITDGNDATTPTTNSQVVNNMIISQNDYGIYLNDVVYTDVYHNTSVGSPGFAINDDEELNIYNNIFVTNGSDFAFESVDPIDATTLVDYNIYFNQSGTGDLADDGNSTYTDLVAWQTADATRNVNSLEGNPVFLASDDLHVIGGLANGVGDNNVGVTTDIDGDTRPLPGSANVDIGADEFDPPAGDLALVGADFIKGLCLSTNDSIELTVQSLVAPVDFAIDPLTANYTVSGPVNSSGTTTLNSGTIGILDSATLYAGNIDLSVPGTYTLVAIIDSNAVNAFRVNDTIANITIDVQAEFEVDPKTVTLASQNDSVEICVNSSFFGSGEFKITEVCHYEGFGTGAGTTPSYMTADDYIEITGVPGADLDGFILEQWDAGGLVNTHTFPPGTVMGPNGTAIIAIGTPGASASPADFYYHGNTSQNWSSGTDAGRILKAADGTIIDAVTYDAFSFPAASGVTASDWSGQITGTSGTAGIRLNGPDNNSASDWVVVNTSVTQDMNVLNPNVPLPQAASAPGLTWTQVGSSTVIDTTSCIVVGPYSSPGTFQYVASFSNPCGSFTDTVTVIVPNCSAPASISGGTVSSNSVGVAFDTTGTNATNFDIEYGSAGFMIGMGTRVSTTMDSMVVTGLANNVCQDFYVRANCGGADTSAWIGPVNLCPEESICTDDMEAYATGVVEGQSALFLPWQATAGAGGSASIVTSQSASGSQSLRLSDPATGPNSGADDLVAYFDTISSGAWEISFEMFIPINHNGYFNIQQNHDFTGANNLWGAEIYFNGSGLAEVLYSTGQVSVGTFSYNHGTWNTVSTFIDLDNDSIWFELNGTTTGLGYAYSLANPGQPLQFNGVNFYTGVQTGDNTTSEFYIDDFCVSPASLPNVCNPPTGLAATSNVGCDSIEVNFNSNTGSSVIEYGPAPLTPGTGTFTGIVTAPYTITGLTANTSYDIRVADTCGTDTSNYASITTSTANSPQPVASFTVDSSIVGGAYEVYVNASASTGATTYSWTYGNGNSGSGVTDTNAYSSNGSYTITLIVTNNCGSDTATFTTNANVGIDEDALSRSLTVYPNPASDVINITFDEVGSSDVNISLSDASGRTVLSLNDKLQSGVYNKAIDVSNLAAGVYILKVNSGELSANRRISVRK